LAKPAPTHLMLASLSGFTRLRATRHSDICLGKIKGSPPPYVSIMNDDTELFDLFGEAEQGCTICLEPMEEGSRVRSIVSCQHTFHAGCLEKWIGRKAECPLCRGELPSLIAASRNTAFLEQVRTVMALLGGGNPPTTLDKRYILTYVVLRGILKRFPLAIGQGGLHASSDQIRQRLQAILVEGVSPLPIDTGSRYALEKLKRGVAAHLAERFSCSARSVQALEHVRAIKAGVQLIPNIQEIWSTF
jgi:hypothetical protein